MLSWSPLSGLIFLLFTILLCTCTGSAEYSTALHAPSPDMPKRANPAETPLNVLLILADDLGYHDLGATGSRFYETPHLDALARRGTSFTQAYAGSRVCSPSRASILLGQFTARYGITDWIGAQTGPDWHRDQRPTTHLPPDYRRALPATATSLAEAFRKGGYTTFFAGKWHLGDGGNHPEDHGFDHNVGGWSKGSPIGGFFDPYENPKLPNERPGEPLSQRLARETKAFLHEHQGDPFFAMLSFYAVHAPLQTTPERFEHFRARAVAASPADSAFVMERRLPIRTAQDHPVYAGLLAEMDAAIGRVLDHLEATGLADHTVVIFTSDNGGVASGDAYATSNAPLRGGKGYQWEGGIREPLLLYVPGQDQPATVDEPVTGADIYPTLLSLAGLQVEAEQILDGRDFSPLLRGQSLGERPLFWHYPHYGNQGGDPSSILRRGDWKMIHYWEDDHDELYHLGQDPGEVNDRSESEPARTANMRRELLDWLEQMNARYPVPNPQFTEEAWDRWRRQVRTERWPSLERRRREMFAPGWVPNEDWWGSAVPVTRD
ncbi:sulfatase [Lewinella sp. W8]|uniref:sulfatase n=1 Tax=Lewinella sp. W8 TaxID=2528208 RepID=UPI00156647F0|nr:sulfatase [Lewinella sp. W8]